MKPFLYIFYLFLLIGGCCSAQNFQLSGTIKDKKGEVLPGTEVYVSGYKIATVTNTEGAYFLTLKPGNYDILVQMIGYKALNKNVVVSDKAVRLDFVLEESTTQLAEVTIKPDPDRAFYMGMFKDFFIGTTPNSALCKIKNPQILVFDYNMEDGILKTKTDEFLIIENQALGYRIKYLLNEFEYNNKTKIIYYEGFPYYEDLTGSSSKTKRWAKKRLEAYRGSSQHFFSSLYAGKTKEEEFELNKLIKMADPNRPSDSLIKANITRWRTHLTSNSNVLKITPDDSLSYWIKQKNRPKEMSVLIRKEVPTDTLVHSFNENIKSLNFKDLLYVIYKGEKEDSSFSNRIGNSISRPLDLPDYQVSLVNLLEAPVYFYQNGAIYNPKSMLYQGYWGWEKMADSVPMDYLPPLK